MIQSFKLTPAFFRLHIAKPRGQVVLGCLGHPPQVHSYSASGLYLRVRGNFALALDEAAFFGEVVRPKLAITAETIAGLGAFIGCFVFAICSLSPRIFSVAIGWLRCKRKSDCLHMQTICLEGH